jgi:hypothetical protein
MRVRWIAQPPKATFVTRLRDGQLPDRPARQLPDQPTTLRVVPSSTGVPRLRGALSHFGSERLFRSVALDFRCQQESRPSWCNVCISEYYGPIRTLPSPRTRELM